MFQCHARGTSIWLGLLFKLAICYILVWSNSKQDSPRTRCSHWLALPKGYILTKAETLRARYSENYARPSSLEQPLSWIDELIHIKSPLWPRRERRGLGRTSTDTCIEQQNMHQLASHHIKFCLGRTHHHWIFQQQTLSYTESQQNTAHSCRESSLNWENQ